jgi:chromate transporter
MEDGDRGAETAPATAERAPLGELAWLFLRLGATSFGGPAAHIALMEHEVVRRRGWRWPGARSGCSPRPGAEP